MPGAAALAVCCWNSIMVFMMLALVEQFAGADPAADCCSWGKPPEGVKEARRERLAHSRAETIAGPKERWGYLVHASSRITDQTAAMQWQDNKQTPHTLGEQGQTMYVTSATNCVLASTECPN